VLFVLFAVVGAVAVFFSVLGYVNQVESQVGDRVTGYVLREPVPAFTPLSPGDLEEVEIPQRWLPDTALRDLNQLVGQVTTADVPAGTLLQGSTLMPEPTLRPEEREVAILVDAETGVAGKLQSGDYVDVWATFDDEDTGMGNRTKLIAQRVLVIGVGTVVDTAEESQSGILQPGQAIPVTFATSDGQIKALTFAESFAAEVRLALRPPGDTSTVPGNERTYAETFGINEDEEQAQ